MASHYFNVFEVLNRLFRKYTLFIEIIDMQHHQEAGAAFQVDSPGHLFCSNSTKPGLLAFMGS